MPLAAACNVDALFGELTDPETRSMFKIAQSLQIVGAFDLGLRPQTRRSDVIRIAFDPSVRASLTLPRLLPAGYGFLQSSGG